MHKTGRVKNIKRKNMDLFLLLIFFHVYGYLKDTCGLLNSATVMI